MDFLTRNTKSLLDSALADGVYISAKDKDVIVIGGGDTGADCIGTSLRHGCTSLVNFELLDQPPVERAPNNPWPNGRASFAWTIRTPKPRPSSATTRGKYAILAKEFLGDERPRSRGARPCKSTGQSQPTRLRSAEVPGAEKSLAVRSGLAGDGLFGPEAEAVREMLGLQANERSNFKAEHGAVSDQSWTGSSRPATAAAANRWSSGPSTKAAEPPAPSTCT